MEGQRQPKPKKFYFAFTYSTHLKSHMNSGGSQSVLSPGRVRGWCPMMRSIQRASGVDLYTYSLSACHCCGSAVCAMILSGWDPSVPLLNLYA